MTDMAHPKNGQTQLVRALTQPADANVCDHIVAQLDDYIDAQLAGEAYVEQYPEVALHLDACETCAELYAALYDLARAEATDSLPQPAHTPDPDLNFLTTETPAPLERLRSAVQQIGERLVLQLTPDLLPPLRPALSGAARRKPADEDRYAEVLLQLDAEQMGAAWPAALAAYRDAQQPDHCLVEVEVAPPGRAWPDLADIPVMLAWDAEERNALTDAWGLAVFEGVPVTALAEIRVEMELD